MARLPRHPTTGARLVGRHCHGSGQQGPCAMRSRTCLAKLGLLPAPVDQWQVLHSQRIGGRSDDGSADRSLEFVRITGRSLGQRGIDGRVRGRPLTAPLPVETPARPRMSWLRAVPSLDEGGDPAVARPRYRAGRWCKRHREVPRPRVRTWTSARAVRHLPVRCRGPVRSRSRHRSAIHGDHAVRGGMVLAASPAKADPQE